MTGGMGGVFGEKRLRASKRKENVRSPGKDVEKYLAQKLQLYKISRNKRVSFFKNIFGTVEKNGVVKDPDEIDEGVDRVKYDPKSIFRARWDLCMGAFIIYTCGILPLRVAFGDNSFGFFSMIDLLIDMSFMLDIYINFNTGYDQGGIIIMDPTYVRSKYLKTWFLFDLVSSFPFDIFVLFNMLNESNYLYFRMPKLLRIFRLPRLFRYLRRWQDVLPINSAALRTMKLVFLILAFAHLNACMQFLIAELEGFPEDGWVVRADIMEEKTMVQYLHSLFRALSHMLCIGYGQEPPRTQLEIWIVISSMLSGASFYIVLIGIMSSLMLSMDRSGAKYREQIEIWTEYFTYAKVPQTLRDRVVKYYKYRWSTRKYFDEEKLIQELSPALQQDISMHVCADLVTKVPIFKACRPVVLASIVPVLRPVSLIKHELIYRTGEIANDMFFILNGEVGIESENGEQFTTLTSGSYFGEFPLIYDRKLSRTAHARALTQVDLFSLSRDRFDLICSVYPELLELMRSIADARTEIFKAQAEMMEKETNRRGGAQKPHSSVVRREGRSSSLADLNVKLSDSYLYGMNQTSAGSFVKHPNHSVIFQIHKEESKKTLKGRILNFFNFGNYGNSLEDKLKSLSEATAGPVQKQKEEKEKQKKKSLAFTVEALQDLNNQEWFINLSRAIENSMAIKNSSENPIPSTSGNQTDQTKSPESDSSKKGK